MYPSRSRITLDVKNDDEESPHYGQSMVLIVSYQPGYPAYVRGAPEDCYPGEGGEVEILEGFWDDGQPISDADLEKVQDETLLELIETPTEEDE